MRIPSIAVVLASLFFSGCSSMSSPTPSSRTSQRTAHAPSIVGASFTSGGAPSLASGAAAQGQSNGAIVISIQTPCHFFDGNGNWTLAIGDCDFHIVVTPGGVILNLTARGQVPPASNGEAVQYDFASTGIPCTIDNTSYSTENWQETVTPSGQVAWSCAFR
ncbi:MAG TPA: hypothetical protein VF785_14290 [Gemmatimonadaceae bacterium]